MKPIQPPESLYLEAAKGWYMLGDLVEARHELDLLPRRLQDHPDVLEVRFAVSCKEKQWTECMEISAALLSVAPDRPTSWINCAVTLHELKQTEQAWDALYTVREKFPEVSAIPYNLACYACQLGRIEDSRRYLRKALSKGGKQLREFALEDPDLKPLWREIELMEQGA
jgi:predicted Zn-dependent protease